MLYFSHKQTTKGHPVNTTPAPAIDTLTCDAYGCETIVADDLGGGWVRVREILYLNPETSNAFCLAHGDYGDVALEDEVDLTRSYLGTES
jgi:hypothetical protein